MTAAIKTLLTLPQPAARQYADLMLMPPDSEWLDALLHDVIDFDDFERFPDFDDTNQ